MNAHPARIGISFADGSPTVPADFSRMLTGLTTTVAEAFTSAGAQVHIIDAVTESTSIADFDAIVIMGGADVDPALYGAEPHATVRGYNRRVDDAEAALVRAAVAEGRPVFGICRGLQLINVALGGTLVQHLGDDGPHRDAVVPNSFSDHEVNLEPGSAVAEALGRTRVGIRSAHHQAADVIAPGLSVTARADDGVVEALEQTSPWVLAVQWHPEAPGADPAQLTALVRAVLDEVSPTLGEPQN